MVVDESMKEKSIAECREYLDIILPEPEYTPTILLGPPGIGKTQMTHQLARDHNYALIESILSIKEPTDVGGIPWVSPEGQYFDCIPDKIYWEVSTDNPDGPPTILFFDDLPTAHPQVQAAFFKVVNEGKVGSRVFRDNVKILAAGNRVSDAAGAHDIPTALANRFSWQHIRVCEKAWLAWATGSARVHPSVVAYMMKWGTTDLSNFDPAASEKEFASPRSWEMVSQHLYVHDRKGRTMDIRDIAGLIGGGIASKFDAFVKIGREAVPIADIIKDPEGARVPKKEELDCLYVTIANMKYYLKEQNGVKAWEPFAKYVLRDEVRDDIAFHLVADICRVVSRQLEGTAQSKALNGKTMNALLGQYGDHMALIGD